MIKSQHQIWKITFLYKDIINESDLQRLDKMSLKYLLLAVTEHNQMWLF